MLEEKERKKEKSFFLKNNNIESSRRKMGWLGLRAEAATSMRGKSRSVPKKQKQ